VTRSQRRKTEEKSRRARRRLVTTGAVMAGFVVIAFLFVFAFPTRTWLDQRSELSQEQQRLELLQTENAKLEARAAELQTDAEVERIAREQFDMVRPGEDAYAILPVPSTTPTPVTTP
jgi:cell division protein FtsB